jgi:hypothetical protein
MVRPTTQNDVNGTLLFRPQADLGTPRRVAEARNHAHDPGFSQILEEIDDQQPENGRIKTFKC